MRTFYLYKKFSEDGASVRKLAEDFIRDGDTAFAVTEHDRRYSKLDLSISKGENGDVIITDAMSDLGENNSDIIRRLRKIIDKRLTLLACDFAGTFTHGISSDINNVVLETIVAMLNISDGNTNIMPFKPKGVGRPSVTFPDGWDEKYENWEKACISSREFMEWSGMKKATFYNKLAEYKELLEQEQDFRSKINEII